MATVSENLYNLIPVEEAKKQKGQRYTSQFRPTAVQEYESNRFAHRTMGEAKATFPPPDSYLKKHARDQHFEMVKTSNSQDATDLKKSDDGKFHYPCDQKKASVPKAKDKPLMGITTNKNFLKQNAVENIMSVSKKPERAIVDRRLGDRFLLEASGLDPVYVKKRDYGKTPEYLDSRKKELVKAREDYENYLREVQKRGEMYKMSEEERQDIIAGLKANWEELHRAYQSLGVMVDTIPKQNRKQQLENEMKILEKDIETLERHQNVYVAN